jgi:hypothetical protein
LQGDKYKGFTLTQRVISSVVSDFNAPADKGYEDNGRSKRRKTTPTEVTAPAKVVYNVPDVNDKALAVELQAEEYDKKPQEAIAETGLLRAEELLTGMDVASSFPFLMGPRTAPLRQTLVSTEAAPRMKMLNTRTVPVIAMAAARKGIRAARMRT